jgi:hypothetical protein
MGYDHFVAGIVEQQSRQQGFDFCLLMVRCDHCSVSLA